MSVISDLIEQIENQELRVRLQQEINKMNKQRKFGLVFEEHVPENTFLYDVPVKRGSLVAKRNNSAKEIYRLLRIEGEDAICEHTVSHELETILVDNLVSVAQLGEPIYPYLKLMGEVGNAPESDIWHTLIEADNYHALQLLAYIYGGKVDCFYIDPPYNKPDSHDWKYNCDYVDGKDNYRHSKWLSMMEKRLIIARKLLNPEDSVLIVTIDELEYLHLGCLLEQMFPEAKVQMVSSITNHAGTSRDSEFSRVNEYIFVLRFGTSVVEPLSINEKRSEFVLWDTLRRHNPKNVRDTQHPNQFYPIYIDNITHKITEIGEPLAYGVDRFTAPQKEGCTAVFPVRDDGTEMMWGVKKTELIKRLEKGYVRVGKYCPEKPQQFVIQFLSKGTIKDIEKGVAVTKGFKEDGSIIAYYSGGKLMMPTTQWDIPTHDARDYGLKLNKAFFRDNRFDFPKSLYAVHDTIRFFVAKKPNALILDFFAGSGTTLHAVNLLNKEDGGHRRCIMVTNNEIGEAKEKELKQQGICPGDDDWEKWGIARYVNWPRTKCSIKGIDVSGNPIDGEYITTKTEIKRNDRRFNQINFLTDTPSLKQKKALVSLINKQKTVKLPIPSEDDDYLLAEDDDSCNASILFNVTAIDDWESALEGHNEITDFFIVTQQDSLFRKIKAELSELMGQIEESVPITIPMKDGFKANAIFFKLGFLDKTSVALGRQFKELLPILWMKAGAKGKCPSIEPKELPNMLIYENNHFAVLINESAYPMFEKKINEIDNIDVVFIITDSDGGYKEMAQGLHVKTTYQLYRDYLDNFRINNVR